MYKKILVPLDGSARAERILPHVEELAAKFGSQLVLLQIVEPIVLMAAPTDMGAYYDPTEIERLTEEATTYLQGLQAVLKTKGIQAEAIIDNGTVVPAILEEAARKEVDLIAMASHGRTGLARAFFGSVATGVLNQSNYPLLLVRAQDE